MPELPEVEIAGRQLERWLTGATIQRVDVLDEAVVRSRLSTRPSDAIGDPRAWFEEHVVGRSAVGVRRHGKRLGWIWPTTAVGIHLGMSGKFVRGDETPRFARLGLVTASGPVWFVDQRRFGCLAPIALGDVDAELRSGHGPDALHEPVDGPTLRSRLKGRRALKVALMDQAVLAGLGNIHVVESLYRCGLSPELPCGSLEPAQADALAAAIPVQLQSTVDAEEAGEMVYMTEGGRDNPFSVYAREGEPCGRCGTTIRQQKMSGRATFWCPGCQPNGAA